MKKLTSILVCAILSLAFISSVSAKAGKSSKKASKVIKSVIGKFAESASTHHKSHRVVLSKEGNSIGEYQGAVYIRHKFKSKFVKYNLPQPKNTWSIMEPLTILFANADADADNELLIIERNMTGIGPTGIRYFYRTRVYDWNGKGFKHLEKVSELIGNARTEARVKLILKNLNKPEKPAKFEKLNTAPFNAKVRTAAREREFWVKMPTLVAANFVGTFSETRKRTLEIVAPSAEEASNLDVIITDDGFADDSVRGVRYKLNLKADSAGIWYVISAEKAQRCYEGRGHQDYSAAPCL